MKFLGFQVQIVVRYHGTPYHQYMVSSEHQDPYWLSFRIVYLLGLFCGLLDAGFGVGTIILTLSAIPLSKLLT